LPEDDELAVVLRTTSNDSAALTPLFSGADLLRFARVVRAVPIAEEVARYAVRLAGASRPGRAGSPPFVNEWVRWGAGLRAAQFLVLGAKARALLEGRYHVQPEDVRALVGPVLRHRVLLSYRAEADGITVDNLVGRLLEAVPA
jgi:MoxR-like ATPase